MATAGAHPRGPVLGNAIGASRAAERPLAPPIQLLRHGRRTRFLDAAPRLSSSPVRWRQIAVEEYAVPACLIQRHEHPDVFLHIVLTGSVKYEVSTRGRSKRFDAIPGTTFILPRGTVDEIRWEGPTRRLAVAIDPDLLAGASNETMGREDIELVEHWALVDPHLAAILQAMRADLADGSPAGRLYGESLANALAVYLVGRYGARPAAPRSHKGGMPGRRLQEGPRLHRREPDEGPGREGARPCRRNEPSLLFGALPKKRGPPSPSICSVAKNRKREGVPTKPEALRPRGRLVGRLREPQPFRACVSSSRGRDPETVPSGLTWPGWRTGWTNLASFSVRRASRRSCSRR